MKDKKKLKKLAIIGGGGLAVAGVAALAVRLAYKFIVGMMSAVGGMFDAAIGVGVLIFTTALVIWMLGYAAKARLNTWKRA